MKVVIEGTPEEIAEALRRLQRKQEHEQPLPHTHAAPIWIAPQPCVPRFPPDWVWTTSDGTAPPHLT